ncbi:hypothetical protein BN130_3439 [Cronobacter malonaticus 507]|nr:hypothetical protein BN130_3439 [Cronobacter malonaticus 507]
MGIKWLTGNIKIRKQLTSRNPLFLMTAGYFSHLPVYYYQN